MKVADMTKGCEFCGEEFVRGKGKGRKEWEIRRFCGWTCSGKARQQALIDDVAWIIDHDNPISVARRVGYKDPEQLVNKLGRNGAHDLAAKLVRNLERYRMAVA